MWWTCRRRHAQHCRSNDHYARTVAHLSTISRWTVSKSTIDRRPKFLDAIIPGRYFNRLGIHTNETLKKLGRGARGWNTFTATWAFWLPFWFLLSSAGGSLNRFFLVIAGTFSTLGGYTLFAAPHFLVFFPGFYYLFYKQGVSSRYISTHIFKQPSSLSTINKSKIWLIWWRAFLTPGIDIGNFTTRQLGHIIGILQVASFQLLLWASAGPLLVELLTGGRTDSFWLFDSLNWLLIWPDKPWVIFSGWCLSFALLSVNVSCGHAWVQRIQKMPSEERAALPR